MPRIVALALVMAVLLALVPGGAHAQICAPGQIDQSDFAGVYEHPTEPTRVTIGPCGSVIVTWANALGVHEAAYITIRRLPDGGLVARIAAPDPWVGSLDNQLAIAVKPAEPNWVQAITANRQEDWIKVYRLRKIA